MASTTEFLTLSPLYKWFVLLVMTATEFIQLLTEILVFQIKLSNCGKFRERTGRRRGTI